MIKLKAPINYRGQLLEAGAIITGLPEIMLKGMLQAGTAEYVPLRLLSEERSQDDQTKEIDSEQADDVVDEDLGSGGENPDDTSQGTPEQAEPSQQTGRGIKHQRKPGR